MATRKAGSRRIVVDDVIYRWRVRHRATYSQSGYGSGELHVAIELADEPGAVLVLLTDRPHPEDWGTRQVVPVRPSDVASWIRQALRAGWVPSADGPQVHARVVGSSVEIRQLTQAPRNE